MLEVLGNDGPASVARRIRCAGDLVSLWYLRPDLLHALATRHGESMARARVEAITAQFLDVLPFPTPRKPALAA